MNNLSFKGYIKYLFSKDCTPSTRMELFNFIIPIITSVIAIVISIYTIIKLN